MTSKVEDTKVVSDEWLMDAGAERAPAFEDGTYLARIVSVVSLGVAPQTFGSETKYKATLAFVLAVYNVDTDAGELLSEDPTMVYEEVTASLNSKSTLTKWLRAAQAENMPDMAGAIVTVELIKSKKDRNYIKGAPTKAMGILSKVIPEWTGELCLVPNLNKMTKEALLSLNSFTQVQKMLIEAHDYAGSVAEELVLEIQAEDADFASYVPNDEDSDDKPKTASKASKPAVKKDLDAEEEFD